MQKPLRKNLLEEDMKKMVLVISLLFILSVVFAQASDLFISEYIEGGSNNKAVEIFNGTGNSVDLSDYQIWKIANGGSWPEYSLTLSGNLADGDVFVIYNSSSVAGISVEGDITWTQANWNGNDAVGLAKNLESTWTLIDAVGEDGVDPGSGWNVAGTTNGTVNHTLVRKSTITTGNTDWTVSSGTNQTDSEWIVYPQDTFDYLGEHTMGGTPLTATPVMAPSGGIYTSTQSVTITCETVASTIYYTTDGSEPDDTSSEYTTALEISSNTTLKAIAYASGFDPSNIAAEEYIFASSVSTITELRNGTIGEAYQLTGEAILTFQQSYRNQKYIQDSGAAILIDDNDENITTVYNRYDGITGIIGTLGEYGGMLQFIPTEDSGVATSTGNVLIPAVITFADLTTSESFEAYEAQLVTIEDVTFTPIETDFANGTVYEISDITGIYSFRTTFYSVDYIGELIPTAVFDLTGILNSRSDGNYITARDAADLQIFPDITIISPNGGESWEQGSVHDITWSSTLYSTDAEVGLSARYNFGDNTESEYIITEDPISNTGSYSWTIPEDMTLSNDYKIFAEINENAVTTDDLSDDFFSIVETTGPTVTVTSPNGGEEWEQDSTHDITWDTTIFTVNAQVGIAVEYPGVDDEILLTPEPILNTGTYSWDIPADFAINNTYKIKIGVYENEDEVYDLSDDFFSVIEPVVVPDPGDVIITEIMQNPGTVGDSNGEYFELYNTTDGVIDINGWIVCDAGSNTATIDNGGPLIIYSNSYLVLGNDIDPLTNGDYTCDYQYSGFYLANGDDEVIIKIGEVIIDAVYYDGGPLFPDPTGASMELDPNHMNSVDNDDGANWYTAYTTYGDGDFGTPGSANPGLVGSLDTPTNVVISHDGTTVTITWDAVTGANSYNIYSSDTPDGTYATEGAVDTNSWSKAEASTKKFYKVEASTDAVPE